LAHSAGSHKWFQEEEGALNYVFDDAWLEERSRLGSLEAVLDPGSLRHLVALGVGPGWSCLEVGAGAGSIGRYRWRAANPWASLL